jgi:IPT/TIG domain/Peptidase M66
MPFLERATGIKTYELTARKGLAALCVLALACAAMIGCGGAVSGNTNPQKPQQPSSSPTIASFAPTSGTVGTSVTVTGTNLTGATSVTVGGAAAATFSVLSETSATLTVASDAVTGKITIVTPAGTATSTNNFTVNAAPPTITSFSPTSGIVGTSVTIAGTNFSLATGVKFNGTTATFSVTDASHIAATVPSGATTGTVSVTTPGGTATSTNNFTVNAAAPTITSFSPTSGSVGTPVTITGANFSGATGVKFNGSFASYGVSDANHIIATVPNGATSGAISVSSNAGTGTSASAFTVSAASGLDLTIDGLYITQATQNYPAHDVGLISGRSAWVRVFVLANEANTATPQVKVNFVHGSTTNALTINAPGSSVPTSVDTTNANASWNIAVPSAWITAGTTVSADVDPANAISESNKSNNHYSHGALNVQTVHQWKITLIPVKTGDGRTGTVENGTRDRNTLVSVARQLWPVPDTVDVAVGAQMTSSQMTLSSDGTGWNTVLSELLAKRTADGVTDRYYFGFLNVSYNSGVAGLGYIAAPAAIGWDYKGAQAVLAHEVGHNFGRQHSPCGGAANPDPNYPYAGGTIGVPGWDVFAITGNIKPTTDTDVMAYCSNQWVSDYVYKSVLNFRASSSFDVQQDVATGAQKSTASKGGVLVWGRIEKGKMILEPAFRVAATGAAIADGPYTWEANDAKGLVLSRVAFQTYEVADLPNDEPKQFAFVVPMDSVVIEALDSMHVRKGENELALQKAKTSATTQSAMKIFRAANLPNRRTEIHWDAITLPVAMLRDAKTGEVRGFLRGGDATVDDTPDNLEIQLSDGVKTSVLIQTRPSEQ